MALYDTRTFKTSNEWWIAQVHGSVGSGFGAAYQASRETVYFTCVSDQERNSVVTDIPAGTVNRVSHRSIVEALRTAKAFADRLPMSPANAPDVEQLERQAVVRDDEGLRWVLTPIQIPWVQESSIERLPVVEAICLDDSALRGLVVRDNAATDVAIVRAVRDQFEDVEVLPV